MVNVVVIYHTRTGNTETMAKEGGADTRLKKATGGGMDDMRWADGIIIGSPTYF